MKRILLALTSFATAGICFLALSNITSHGRQQLRANQNAWLTQTQQLAEVQAEQGALAAKIRDLKHELRSGAAAASMDPALVEFLLTNGSKSASPEMQDKLLAGFGRGGNSSSRYVLVSKAALRDTTLRPLKTFPNGEKLTDAVRGVLAITPEEQQAVEAAFAGAFDAIAVWAKANVQRDGPSGDLLVRYTIPADQKFEQASTSKLFSIINATVGDERGELMRKYFEINRFSEDGGIGDGTNVFEIHRISGQAGLGYRSGREWENSSAINTYPEPIKPDRFPSAFFFVFPGGWQEIAQREGFELPEEFHKKP
ncbi:MAG: hypothetical protein QOJ40_2028 [Verrucomicrobiota bacterium]